MEVVTRKLPRNTTKAGAKNLRGEYLLPQLGETPAGFVGSKTGKTFENGYLVYLGRDFTPEMLLDEYCEYNTPPRDLDLARERLAAFVQELQNCKVGNLISISYSAQGLPKLKIEREFLLAEPSKKLP